MLSRRRFLASLSALAATPALTHAQSLLPHLRRKVPAPAPPNFVYFGTDTTKGISKGIYLSRFNAASGQISPPAIVAATARPTYLASSMRGGKRHLYAVNATSDPGGGVTSFLADPATGALTQLNQVSSAGAGPCYISVDATGHAAFVANYNGSSIASYQVEADGTLSQPVERIDFMQAKFGQRGPNTARQDVAHPHCVTLSPDNRFLIVNDLGSDAISVFVVDAETAHLTQAGSALFRNDRPGSGPRHIVFHPNGRWVYSINELDSTVDQFLWTATSSRTAPEALLVKAGNGVRIIAKDYPTAKNTAAELAVSSDGNFLYASNRGEDSLVVLSIAQADGALSLIQRISCGGRGPRHFTLDPTGRWLICGNQDSASLTVFRRDGASGRLGGPVQTVPLDSPMFTLFA